MTRKPRVSRAKRPARQKRADPAAIAEPTAEPVSEIETSNLSLHDLFEQQAAEMLEGADLDEEQRQSIMLAMSCPCCGAGGPSFSFKLRRK
jgi:hypothetical protein